MILTAPKIEVKLKAIIAALFASANFNHSLTVDSISFKCVFHFIQHFFYTQASLLELLLLQLKYNRY